MVRTVTLAEFSDLLSHAATIGIDWNTAHDILVRDNVCPMYECNQRDLYLGMGKHYGWTDESSRIVDTFLNANGITNCTLVND